MRVTVPLTTISDMIYNAEQLYAELLDADLLLAAASVKEAVDDLRQRVREEREGA